MTKIETILQQMTTEQRARFARADARENFSSYRRVDCAQHILGGAADFETVSSLREAHQSKDEIRRALRKAGQPMIAVWCRASSGGKYVKSVAYAKVQMLPKTAQQALILSLYQRAAEGSGLQIEWDAAKGQARCGKALLPNEIDESLKYHRRNLRQEPALPGEIAVPDTKDRYRRMRWTGEAWETVGVIVRLTRDDSHPYDGQGGHLEPIRYWEHGATVDECRTEAARKTAIAREQLATWRTNNRNQVRNAQRARLITRLCANHLVDAAQVREAGACQAGIDAWCRAHAVASDSALPLTVLAQDRDALPFALAIARQLRRSNHVA